MRDAQGHAASLATPFPRRSTRRRRAGIAAVLAALAGLLLPATAWAKNLAQGFVVWVPTPGTPVLVSVCCSEFGSPCTPITATSESVTVPPKMGSSVTFLAQTYTDTSCSPAVTFPGPIIVFTYTTPPLVQPGSSWDTFQALFTFSAGTTTDIAVVFEGMPGTSLGRPGGAPCTACQAAQGQVSAPPPATDDLPFVAEYGVSSDGRVAVGAPIDIGTGNVYYEHTDYTTAGPNRLAFTRSYNSGAMTNSVAVSFSGTSGAAHHWRSNFDASIDVLNTYTVLAERPDGRVLPFYYDSNTNAWGTDSNIDYDLLIDTGYWVLTGPDGTTETYPVKASGATSLYSIAARNGYWQLLSYADAARTLLSSVTDVYGRTLSFTHNADGTIASVATPDQTTISYAYNAVFIPGPAQTGYQLASVTYPTSPTPLTYQYTDASLPFALTGVTDENNNPFLNWTYDATGRGTGSVRGGAVGADSFTLTYPMPGVTTVTNALGVTDTYTFTQLGPASPPVVSRITRAATSTTAAAQENFTYDPSSGYLATRTDWNGNQTSYSYTNNAHGLPTTVVEGVGTPWARTVTIVYDTTFPRLPHTITSEGVVRSIVYDTASDLGNPLTITLQDATTTTMPYITEGQTRTWTNTWSKTGQLLTTLTPNGNQTSYDYDTGGALNSIQDALKHKTTITNTPGGRPSTIVDPNGVTTNLVYDQRQRLLSSTVKTAAGTRTTSLAYDFAGNLTQTTLPDGSFLTYGYDTAHRLTTVTDMLGDTISYTLDALGDRTATAITNAGHSTTWQHAASYDALGRLLTDFGGGSQNPLWSTTYTYDAGGNVLTVTDGLGHTTTNTFDAFNRLATSTDVNSGVTTLTYDTHDRVTSVQDALTHVTSYVIDGFGERIGQTSPDTGDTVWYYDDDGNPLMKTDADGNMVTMTYDALDRLWTRSYAPDTMPEATYTYDTSAASFQVGRLASRSDAAGVTAFTYDERGNLLTSINTPMGGAGVTTAYAYDQAGRPQSITYPSGLMVAYKRDAQGNISRVDVTPPGGSAVHMASSVTTQPFGPDSKVVLHNGITETRVYDQDYRLQNVTASGNATLENLGYSFDQASNVTTITDTVNAANSQTFTYDNLNRLYTATAINPGGYGRLSWSYDGIGNRQQQIANNVITSYAYDPASSRITGITEGSNPAVPVVTGPNGTVTSIPPANASAAASFTYNSAGRLASVTSGTTTATSAYDDWGQRISKTAGGITTAYAYGQDRALLEEATGGTVTDYIYMNGRLLGLATVMPASATPMLDGGAADGGTMRFPRVPPLPLGELFAAGLLLAAVGALRSRRPRLASTLTPLALGLAFAACGSGRGVDSAAGAGGGGPDASAAMPDGGTEAGSDGGGAGGAGGASTGSSSSGMTDSGSSSGSSSGDAGTDGGSGGQGTASGSSSGAGGTTGSSSSSSGGTSSSSSSSGTGGGDAGAPPITTLYYAHTDRLGTPQLVTDGSQNIVWSATYQPFGGTVAVTGSLTQDIRLPGQVFDAETGLHQNGFRDYHPALGRYLESDPIGLAGGANTYAYVGGNPMKGIDPLGLQDTYINGNAYPLATNGLTSVSNCYGVSITGNSNAGFNNSTGEVDRILRDNYTLFLSPSEFQVGDIIAWYHDYQGATILSHTQRVVGFMHGDPLVFTRDGDYDPWSLLFGLFSGGISHVYLGRLFGENGDKTAGQDLMAKGIAIYYHPNASGCHCRK
jgi:RHS repeat-associated protein